MTQQFGPTSSNDRQDLLDNLGGRVTVTTSSKSLATLSLTVLPSIRYLGLYPLPGESFSTLRIAIGTATANTFAPPAAGITLPIGYANALLLELISTSGNVTVQVIQTR